MTIRSYDTFDEMMADMHEAENIANARVTPEQRAITYGSYWYTYAQEIDLHIWGYVMTEQECDQSERDCGAPDDERKESATMLCDAHERGYRFGRAYSVAEPDGELGSTHIASMVAHITKEGFELARNLEWSMDLIKEHLAQL